MCDHSFFTKTQEPYSFLLERREWRAMRMRILVSFFESEGLAVIFGLCIPDAEKFPGFSYIWDYEKKNASFFVLAFYSQNRRFSRCDVRTGCFHCFFDTSCCGDCAAIQLNQEKYKKHAKEYLLKTSSPSSERTKIFLPV